MIGGPTDLVVEPNIVRAVGAREVTREPSRVATEPTTYPLLQSSTNDGPSGSQERGNVFTRYTLSDAS